jgi:hypothetical protein
MDGQAVRHRTASVSPDAGKHIIQYPIMRRFGIRFTQPFFMDHIPSLPVSRVDVGTWRLPGSWFISVARYRLNQPHA